MTINVNRPLPAMQRCAVPFWESIKKGELAIQKCKHCGKYIFHPKFFCPECLSDELEWEVVSGKATLYTFVTFEPGQSPFGGEEGLTVALVDLDIGIRMCTNIINTEPEDIKIGMDLKFEPLLIREDFALPTFTKA
jgi:hypothetical protein